MVDGAALLGRYISKARLGVRSFGRAAGVPAAQVCRYLKRKGTPGLVHAFRIEDATRRAVPARAWLQDQKRKQQV